MITILDDTFSELNAYLESNKPSKIIFLTDENTHEHCLPFLLSNVTTEVPYEVIEIEPGEELKTIDTATQLWEILSDFEADRKTLMINLGGGVITDLGGFVASTYKRGVSFINIPTTLLAMCDAAIGGKNGIDHQFLKNIVGTFANAEQIFIYPGFLETLPYTDLRSGFAEMLKHGLIADRKHWEDLTAISELRPENIAPFIERSTEIKQEIVQQDFKEQNIRKTLNFGHTIGHALESLFLKSGRPIPHGEAIAIGMICETRLSYLNKLITEEVSDEIIKQIKKYFPLHDISSFKTKEILHLMTNDKKNSLGEISFSLIDGIGSSCHDQRVSDDEITEVLTFYNNMTA
ncbi:3-dehydroquinate synthase [Kaistella rhinocerotis]|uniref:3-dehydroquinate synthase n=1 Tax=Kaistella rhinocerotis TaxID=3026437 RepID=UPI002552EA32|nr:3-dehydroquinate synthase [Kaistella sp. Ran72]